MKVHPQVRTILIVRLDPSLPDNLRRSEVRDEYEPDSYLAARKRQKVSIADRSRETGFTSFERELFTSAVASAGVNLADAVIRNQFPDDLTRVVDLHPTRSTRRINGYRNASELDLEFDWRSVPFDSRIVRAIMVFHYEGLVPASAWGTGAPEEDPSEIRATGFRIPATGTNLRFIGFADDVSDEHGQGDVFQLKARDLTGILIDSAFPPKQVLKFPSGTNVLAAIRTILDTNPLFKLIRGPFSTPGVVVPTLDQARYSDLSVSAASRHSGGGEISFRVPSSGGASGQTNYWDVITDLCVSHGLRPTIDLNRLVLTNPRNLYSKTPEEIEAPGVVTFPSRYRKGLGEKSKVRRMVFGVNVTRLRRTKKLSRTATPAVLAKAYDPNARDPSKRTISKRWPPKSQTVKSATPSPSGGEKEEKVFPIEIHGVKDPSQLLEIAKQTYEGIARLEQGVQVETSDVWSYAPLERFDPSEDPDLLAIRAGDPVQILVASPEVSRTRLFTLTELQKVSQRAAGGTIGTLFDYLVSQGYERRSAKQLARVLANADLPTEFRLISATVSFDKDSGFGILLDLKNYLKVRIT